MSAADHGKPEPTCIVCGSEGAFLFDKDGYSLYECPKCALVFVHPQPARSFLEDEVYSERSGYQANKAKDLSAVTPTGNQRKLLGYLRDNPSPHAPNRSFLDIGCSSGELMCLVKKLGFAVTGVELNRRTAAIAKANGLDVRRGALAEADLPSASFDIVHMGDLIEHVPDPKALIVEAGRLLKPDGILIIVTPNMDCFWSHATLALWRVFKIPWSSATPPHHLWQFSVGNLKSLLGQNGFILKASWFNRAPSLKYELGSLHLLKRFKSARASGSDAKAIKALSFMLFSFSAYSIMFALNRIAECLTLKRFGMAMVFEKARQEV